MKQGVNELFIVLYRPLKLPNQPSAAIPSVAFQASSLLQASLIIPQVQTLCSTLEAPIEPSTFMQPPRM